MGSCKRITTRAILKARYIPGTFLPRKPNKPQALRPSPTPREARALQHSDNPFLPRISFSPLCSIRQMCRLCRVQLHWALVAPAPSHSNDNGTMICTSVQKASHFSHPTQGSWICEKRSALPEPRLSLSDVRGFTLEWAFFSGKYDTKCHSYKGRNAVYVISRLWEYDCSFDHEGRGDGGRSAVVFARRS